MAVEAALLRAIWFILPAYFANSMPVQFSKLRCLERYGKPIDGGRSFQGVRILGDGKTWRGLFLGLTAALLVGGVQALAEQGVEDMAGFPLPDMSLPLALMLGLGTMAGDMVASFVKRRAGVKSGDPAPLLDQLDFVFGAFFFAWMLTGSLDYNIFFAVVVITPILHLFANFVAWIWKLKKNPW